MLRDLAANTSYTPALFDTVAILSCFRNCENMISIAAVEEVSYRQSRLCRLLVGAYPAPVISLAP